MFATAMASAQEALRNSWSGEAAAGVRQRQIQSPDYTFREGDFRVQLSPSFGAQWVDNINLARTNLLQDYIISPGINLVATYPLSTYNILNLSVGLSYNEYLEHSYLSTWSLSTATGTELYFGMVVGDFNFDFHDRVSYTPDSATETAVSGTDEYRSFNNTAGFLITWDLNEMLVSLGYDHANTISGSGQFQSINQSSELVAARVGAHFTPKLTVGLETTGTFTSFQQALLNNNSSYTAGIYANWKADKFFKLQFRVGYSVTEFQQSGSSITNSNIGSYYLDLTVSHQITKAVNYSFSLGRETTQGIQSDAIQDYYFRPTITWDIVKSLTLQTFLTFEQGNQGVGNISGNLTETYDYYGAGISLSYPLMKKLTGSFNYRLIVRASDDPTMEYTQNSVGLNLSYHF